MLSYTITQHQRVKPYLTSPIAPSGSIVLTVQERIKDNWFLQYGGRLGTMGFMIRTYETDTLSNFSGSRGLYPHYDMIFGSLNLSLGRRFTVMDKSPVVYLGAGVTHYFDPIGGDVKINPSTLTPTQWGGSFDYRFNITDKMKGFLKLSAQYPLGKKFLVGLQYVRHFKPAVNGIYNFSHSAHLQEGDFSVTQESLGFLALFRISKPVPE